jgi:Ser/Thr protein kinase RdoA (MazF antagonist)
MRRVAAKAVEKYDFQDATLLLLAHGHNHVYRVDVPSSGRFVLRIQPRHRVNDQGAQSQLVWLEALSRAPDLVVPTPVRSADGALFATVETEGVPDPQRCVMLRWVEGKRCPSTVEAITPTLVASVGQALARLHQHSRKFEPPEDFECPKFDANGLLGANSVLESGKAQAHLKPAQHKVLAQAAKKIRRTMRDLDGRPEHFGLIHGDAGFRNFVYHKGEARLIDFDEFGWGYYLYDLAEPLRIMLNWDNYRALKTVLLNAYESHASSPLTQDSQIDIFIAATLVSYLTWGFCRASEEDYRTFLRFVPGTLQHLAELCP